MLNTSYKNCVSKLVWVMLIGSLSLYGCGDKQQTTAPTPEKDATTQPATTQPNVEAVNVNAPEQNDVEVTVSATAASNNDSNIDNDNNLNNDSVEEAAAPDSEPLEAVTVQPPAEAVALSANAGKELYEAKCQMCHKDGLLGAPKFGDKEAWKTRKAQGIDTLHHHSAQGFNKMPPQAVGEVTEAQVYAAVDYMVEHSS